MKMPKSLKIGGHVYTVQYVDRGSPSETCNLGTCYSVENKMMININEVIARSQQEESLMHEIVEAIKFLYQLDFNHSTVSILAEVLYQIFNENEVF